MKKILKTRSQKETEDFAKEFAATLGPCDVVAFFGDLGAGKTAFSRGVVCGLGFSTDVTSPTFAIVNEYQNQNVKVAHFDMYRIASEDELFSTGYYDYLERCILLIEWSENIVSSLPENRINITITSNGQDERTIEIHDMRG